MKYRLLVDHVEKGDVGLQYVPTNEMLADMFPKNLKRSKLQELMKLFNIS